MSELVRRAYGSGAVLSNVSLLSPALSSTVSSGTVCEQKHCVWWFSRLDPDQLQLPDIPMSLPLSLRGTDFGDEPEKLPSMKDSSQSSFPCSSNADRKLLQITMSTPFSCHSWRRRQQVEKWGYLSGRSFQRAPVLSIQRMPSKTKRSSCRRRPPLGSTGTLGIWGSIFLHCSSLRYTTRLLTGSPPANQLYQNNQKSKLLINSRYHTLTVNPGFATASRYRVLMEDCLVECSGSVCEPDIY